MEPLMNFEQEKRELRSKIDALLAKTPLTTTDSKKADLLMAKLSDLKADESRAAQAKAVLAEMSVSTPVEEAHRSAADQMAAFRNYISTGRDEEIRTYTPMTTGGIPLPAPFYSAYLEQLKSFSGIREAGARVITTTNGDPLKNPFSSDTTVGELLAENATASLANPTFSDTVFTAWTYSSKGVQYSANLQKDSGIDVETFLSGIFASRIGRKFNADATNGVGSGMTGIIPSVGIIGAGSSATAVAYGDLVDLQNIDAGYLPGRGCPSFS
jgi:HK97 family phage major capsid protein